MAIGTHQAISQNGNSCNRFQSTNSCNSVYLTRWGLTNSLAWVRRRLQPDTDTNLRYYTNADAILRHYTDAILWHYTDAILRHYTEHPKYTFP